MLKIILNRLQPQAQNISEEEQAGFKSERQGAPQGNYSLSVSSAKSTWASAEFLPCGHRVQEGFWQGMDWSLMDNSDEIQKQCNIILVIENLYDKAQSIVLFNGSTGNWFKTIIGPTRVSTLTNPS